MRAEIAIGGLGSGVVLVWLWNAVLPGLLALGLPEAAQGWPEMPAEVAVAVSPGIIALLERWIERP